MPSSAPDWRLVVSARSGDRPAFARLVQRWQQPLAEYLWALGVRAPGGVLVEVFVAAYHQLGQAEGYPSVRAWLYAVANREVPASVQEHVLLLVGREGFSNAEAGPMLAQSAAAVEAAFKRAKRGFTAQP